MFFLILVSLLTFYVAFLLFIYVGTFLNCGSKQNKSEKLNFISVIIAARNEEKFLPQLLSSLANQNYPQKFFEVIAVSDRSEDRTDAIIHDYVKRNENFHFVRINEEETNLIGKKNAITKGIKETKGEILLFTDADCVPNKNWISSTNSKFNAGSDFVAGYSPLIAKNITLYEKIILLLKNLERLSIFTISAGTVGWNWGVTAAARNIAYRKKMFIEVSGFSGIGHIPSGDDDLFLQKISITGNYHLSFNYDPDSFVPSHEDKSGKALVDQEKRRASKWKYYPAKIKIFTTLIFCFFILLFIAFIASVIGIFSWTDFLIIFGAKVIIDFLIVFQGALIFKSLRSLLLFPLAEIFYIPYFLGFAILGTFSKYRWK